MKLPMDLIWFAVVAAFVLMVGSLWLLREAAVPILELGIPALLALAGVGRWIDRGAAGPAP